MFAGVVPDSLFTKAPGHHHMLCVLAGRDGFSVHIAMG